MMKSSVEAQAQIRRNLEEQSSLFDEFKAWETKIKLNDAKIKSRIVANEVTHPKPLESTEHCEYDADECGKDQGVDANSSSIHQIATSLQRSTSSVVISGTTNNENVSKKNVVPIAPMIIDEQDSHKSQTKEEMAIEERKRGNKYFSEGAFQEAKNCYSRSIYFDNTSAVAYSNRGMDSIAIVCLNFAIVDVPEVINKHLYHSILYYFRSNGAFEIERLALCRV